MRFDFYVAACRLDLEGIVTPADFAVRVRPNAWPKVLNLAYSQEVAGTSSSLCAWRSELGQLTARRWCGCRFRSVGWAGHPPQALVFRVGAMAGAGRPIRRRGGERRRTV